MRRSLLHICAALFAFLIGFLVSGSDGSIVVALLLAIFFFTLVKTLINPHPELHYVKVAVLTLLIWVPFAKVVINFAFPSPLSCEIYGSEADQTSGLTPEQRTFGFDWPVNESTDADVSDCSCGNKKVNPAFSNPIWVGVIDGKAISKPTALYPQNLKSAHVRGVVAVSVLIDEAGRVVRAESISGHPLLREAARSAACKARFAPPLVDGIPPRVSGILTYRFGF